MKKFLAVALALLMVVAITAGCAKKEDPATLLQKTFDQSITLESLSTHMTMTANVEANEAMMALDPNMQGILDTVNAGKIIAEMASDSKKGNANGKFIIDANGMSFTVDLFMTDFAQMVLKTPISDKYVTMDLAEANANATNVELMQKINKELSSVFMAQLKPEYLTAEYNVDFEGKEGKAKLNYVTISMDNTQFVTFLKEMVPAMYASESFKQLMVESMTKSMESAGQEVTPEAIQEQIDASLEQLPTMLDQMQENLTFDSTLIKIGVDKDYNTRDMVVDMTMTAKQDDAALTIKANIDTEYYGFNLPVEPSTVEITDENSMPFEELLMQLIFGGFGM